MSITSEQIETFELEPIESTRCDRVTAISFEISQIVGAAVRSNFEKRKPTPSAILLYDKEISGSWGATQSTNFDPSVEA